MPTPAPLSAKLLKNGTLKTYKGFPHGMPTTEAATINADLLAFIKAMKIILFGATGMVGQGVLRECLLDPGIETVLAVGRSPTGCGMPELREIIHDDFHGLFSDRIRSLTGYDACFFCLGVSSVGMGEERYRHLTYDITMAAAADAGAAQSRPWCSPTSPAAAPTPREQGRGDVGARQGQDRERSARSCRSRRPTCFVPPASSRCTACAPRPAGFRRSMSSPRRCCPFSFASRRNYMTTSEQIGRAMIKVAATAIRRRCWRARTSTGL